MAYTPEDIAQAVIDGVPNMLELMQVGLMQELAEFELALGILDESGLRIEDLIEAREIDAELSDGLPDWSTVDFGEAQALVGLLNEGDESAFVELAELGESNPELAAYIITTSAEAGSAWAVETLEYGRLAEEAEEAARHDGVEFNETDFQRSYRDAKADGNPALAYAFMRGELEPTPPEISVEWARPHEALGQEGNRHKVNSTSDSYDHAFAEFFAEERNRQNGHPQALEPDPEIQGDPMTRANLDSIADDWQKDIDRAESIHRHQQQLQRKRAATV